MASQRATHGVTETRSFSSPIDGWLLAIALAIFLWGIITVASASVALGDRYMHDAFHYPKRQGIFALLGLSLTLIIMRIPLKVWQANGMNLLGLSIFLLILVILPGVGDNVKGGMRWINLGVFKVQVSEPVKLCILVYLAGYLVRHQKTVAQDLSGLLYPMLVIVIVCLLLQKQNDFGTAAVLIGTAIGMLFVGGARLRWLGLMMLCAILLLVLFVFLFEYRLRRIQIFLNPWQQAQGDGYQIVQSLIAIGRGEWFGVGLGNSVQKLFYLPEVHTDFVFAVLAEEYGFFGSVALIGLYFAFLYRAVMTGRDAAENGSLFGAYLAFGIAIWIGIQAFINLGVNMAVLPTKGLTLPLMSYGGSSLLVTFAAIGLLLRISYEGRTGRYRAGYSRWRLA